MGRHSADMPPDAGWPFDPAEDEEGGVVYVDEVAEERVPYRVAVFATPSWISQPVLLDYIVRMTNKNADGRPLELLIEDLGSVAGMVRAAFESSVEIISWDSGAEGRKAMVDQAEHILVLIDGHLSDLPTDVPRHINDQGRARNDTVWVYITDHGGRARWPEPPGAQIPTSNG